MQGDEAYFQNVSDVARFREAIRCYDALNATDPNRENDGGGERPRELVQAERLSAWVMRLSPGASEALRLAARSQHLCRWQIPRASHELTRAGYHQWRNELKRFHAERSGKVLREVGYGEEIITSVGELNLKKNFPTDPQSRVLEDALCLVFLQFQLADLAGKTDEAKLINALQKSWKKMTPAAHAEALALSYGAREKELIGKALSTTSGE